MGFWRWFSRLFRDQPKFLDQVPEEVGYLVDEHGQQHPIHRGWIKHESLSRDQLQRIARLRDVLIDAYPMTLDGWIDGFMRDAHPESEIQIIEACAVVYHQLTTQADLSVEEKKRLYGVLCAISSGADGAELAAALPLRKSFPSVDDIIRDYREARQRGRRP